jgi:hypothetical protein
MTLILAGGYLNVESETSRLVWQVVWDPQAGEPAAETIAEMLAPRASCALLCLSSVLYIFFGLNGKRPTESSEKLDLESMA